MNTNQSSRIAIYARKSTESEDRQILSIDSQVSELRSYARRAGLSVVDVYTESMSAKAPGRPVFTELLSLLKPGRIDGILCWKLDRLARNPVDGGALIWAMEESRLRSIHTPQNSYSNTGNDKFWMQMEFGMAKKYVDDLSDNTKRGLRAKLELGWMPGPPPIGYLNDKEHKTVVKDPDRFLVIRQMWDLMLTGLYSPPQVLDIATNKWGLRRRPYKRSGGGAVAVSTIYAIFGNPFYYGTVVYGGQKHQGAHEAMVTKGEFDAVQSILASRGRRRPKKLSFAYTGLIRCGECGASVTAENKYKLIKSRGTVKRYVYYHCTKRKQGIHCSQRAVEKEDLESQIVAFLGSIRVAKDYLDWVLKVLESMEGEERERERAVAGSLADRISSCRHELSELTNLRLRGLIEDDEFTAKRNELHDEIVNLTCQLEETDKQNAYALKRCREVFEFAESAKVAFVSGTGPTRRAIFGKIGSNCVLKDRKLLITAAEPFQVIREFVSGAQTRNGMFEPPIQGLDSTRSVACDDGSCALLRVIEDVLTAVRKQSRYPQNTAADGKPSSEW